MLAIALAAVNANAEDITITNFVNWGVQPSEAAYCYMASYIDDTTSFSGGFYVDFFVDRSAPPSFGEFGDYWFYVDPLAMRAWYMDGRELPQGGADHILYLNHVGQIRFTDDDKLNVYLMVPDSGSRWWDVIVNGGSDVTETNYNNNWEDVYTSCQ